MNKLKITLIISLSLLTIFSGIMFVQSTSAENNGLYAEIITDKENYSEGEDIMLTIKLENKNNYQVENIFILGMIPDDFTLKSGELERERISLGANESTEVSFVAVKQSENEILTVTPTPTTTIEPTRVVTPTPTVAKKQIVKVKSIKLNKKKITLKRKKSKKLKVTINPINTTNKKILWKSSNRKIVKVNAKGKVTALKKGKAKIYAKTKDGSKKKAVCKVIVKK